MANWRRSVETGIVLGLMGLSVGSVATVQAGMSEQQYWSALKSADRSVERQKQLAHRPGALSAAVVKSLLGRYYRVGDSWDVAAFHEIPTLMRKTEEEKKLKVNEGLVAVFHYEVLNVATGETPKIEIQISQKAAFGIPWADSSVERVILTVDDRLVQSKKDYYLKAAPQIPVSASVQGLRSSVSILEFFPLDIPDVVTADLKQPPSALPRLPSALQEIASKVGFVANNSRASWFDQSDFFGRPVDVFWEYGDPWPKYLKTAQGVAILIHKEVE